MNGKPTPRNPKRPQNQASAEEIALKGLSFLVAAPARLGGFLESSGLRPDTIRAAAGSPGFLVGLLDHIVSDDKLLISFAAEVGLKPEAIMQARQILSPSRSFE